MVISGIDIEKLDERMKAMDWEYAFYDPLEANSEAETPEDIQYFNYLESIVWDLTKLADHGWAGKIAAQALTEKHWMGQPMEIQIQTVLAARNRKVPEISETEDVKKYSQPILLNTKNQFMNTDNLKYLQGQVKYMGFGEGLNKAIENNLNQELPEFQIMTKHEFGKDKMEAVLYFKRSEKTDMYFFNKYDATLAREKGKALSRTFYVNQGQSITFKEACNLLNGRSVEKELTRKMTEVEKAQYKAEMQLPPEQRGLPENWAKAPTYKAWLKLDLKNLDKNGEFTLKQYHEKYGFNVEEAIKKMPLKYDNASSVSDLVKSLQKGNVQQVTLQIEGEDKKMFIEANPQFKGLTVYDENMQFAKKETYSQQHIDEASKEHVSDLVDGPDAPWEEPEKVELVEEMANAVHEENMEQGKGKEMKQEQTQSEKKSEKNSKKVDLLPKKIAKNNLLPKKHNNKGRGMGIS